MKRSVLLLLVITLFKTMCPQAYHSLSQKRIDSIRTLIDAKSGIDTAKVERLNDLARLCFLDMQYYSGLSAAEQARQLAAQLNYKKGLGMYFRTMATYYDPGLLSLYYDVNAKWLFAEIRQKEILPNLEMAQSDSVLKARENTRLFEALQSAENKQDKEATANILYKIGFNKVRSEHDTALADVDRAFQLFKEIGLIVPAGFALELKLLAFQEKGKIKEAAKVSDDINRIISDTHQGREACVLAYEMGGQYYGMGKKAQAIEIELKALNELEEINENQLRIRLLADLGINFQFLSMTQKAVDYYKKAVGLIEQTNEFDYAIPIYFNLGFELVSLKKYDESKEYFSKAKNLSVHDLDPGIRRVGEDRYADAMGQIAMGREKYQDALDTFGQAGDGAYINYYKGFCYQNLGNFKEAIHYGEKSYQSALLDVDDRLIKKVSVLLSEVYQKTGEQGKAFEYLKKYRDIVKQDEEQDIVNRTANLEIQAVIDKDQREKDQLEKNKLMQEKQNQNQRWWIVSIAGALLSTVIIVFILSRHNRNKQRANTLLQKQKEQIQSTLSELKSAQAQLIQSEKMASLGELTAGIAHEIQNPLNFVNNFSEVNKELIEEIKSQKSKLKSEEIDELLNDIAANEEKINHHGKRADAIVKGMLQHSRSSTGVKEPTNIKALVGEYLRLAYHGLRAKDSTVNATMKTDYDGTIGKINIVPQDIGRVLLNLYDNAFYAVTEKKKITTDDYEPTVSVSTKKTGGKVEINVKDNGNGIPQKIVDKIFQPFFTTKPTGQGTGLGLSLSYDIIKAHGGEIKVETKEGEGTEFIIQLPFG